MKWGKTIRVVTLMAAAVLLGYIICGAQENSRTLILERADSTRLVTTEDGVDSYSYGNVLFILGEDHLACDRAAWLRSQGVIVCVGAVTLTQPHRFLHADSIIYTRADQTARAFGNALLVDSLERMRLSGERMTFDRRTDFVFCDSFPRMIIDFDDSTALTEISGERLDFDRAQRRGWAHGNVVVHRGQWTATCELAETRPDSGLIILTENPVGWGSNTETKGDSIILYSINRLLEKVEVIGDAEGVYRPQQDSLAVDSVEYQGEENRLWGQRIVFYLADSRLNRIRALGSARSKYKPGQADSTAGELHGENHTSGDTLTIYLHEQKIERAEIRGGGRGSYLNPIEGDSITIDTIRYFGDRIEFEPDSSRIYLFGSSKIEYGTIELTADQIRYNTQKKTLAAAGRPDPDSAGLFIDPPILQDGNQTVYGEKLTYNVNTGRGRISGSFTEHERAYYRGEDFHKYTDREFYVENGVYTTCDHDPPHFSFRGKTMKMIRGDKVISRPVVLYIDEMPLFAIPFYIFPIKPGRHSGFLSMHFGNFEQGQRFVDNLGYYWAASEYWDLESAINIREETGIEFRNTVRYALRYILNGAVTWTYARESRWLTSADPPVREKRTRWSLVATHRHTISPTMSVSGNASFVSDPGYYQEFSYDPDKRRNRILRSQVNFNKRWQSASLTAYMQNTDNLDTDEQTRQLPAMNFTLFSRQLIPSAKGTETKDRWYNSIRYNYSAKFSHDVFNRASGDERYATLIHKSAITASQKMFGYISITPRISGQETWYYVFDTDRADEEGVLTDEPARRGSFSLGMSANSNLYGFLYPRVFGLEAFRHTLSPSIGYAFAPAVTKHDELRQFTRRGSGSSRPSQTLSFRLSQTLDAKIVRGGKERKIPLLRGSVSTGYNFEAEQRKWSTLRSSLGTSLARQVSLSVSAVHDIYDPKTLDLRWTNPRMTSFNVSTGTSLRGGQTPLVTPSEFDAPDSLAPGGVPFNASISYRYSETRRLTGTSKSHWISGSMQIQPTPNWRVRFNMNYDLVRHQVSDQSFDFYRDLHCWEGHFVWIPGGGRKGYYFKINVKAIPDVKIEKSESGIRGAVFR